MIDFKNWINKIPLTDSRQIRQAEHCVFFAIKGKLNDGHRFIADLYKKGVREFVVSEEFSADFFSGAIFYLVENPLEILQKWAAFHRKNYKLEVLGITGSNGKTIVKEWLYQLLSGEFNIVKSPKSYNSQLGVPLSVLQIQEEHQLGIFEAGISQCEEMKHLEKIIAPEFGIFTNIGPAHAEGFCSMEEKILEKLQLFKNSQTLIYCSDYINLDFAIKTNLANTKLLAWGFNSGSAIQVSKSIIQSNSYELNIRFEEKTFSFKIPFSDKASVENVIHCIVFMLFKGISAEIISEKLPELKKTISMRLEWKAGINRSMIIDDAYNNDLAGLRIALDFMSQKHQENAGSGRTVILSDILESGVEPVLLYQQVSNLLKDFKIDKFIGIGKEIYKQQNIFNNIPQRFFWESTEAFFADLDENQLFNNETILIKGARSFAFEKIIRRLRKKTHSTVLELDLNAMLHNYHVYKKVVHPGTKLMVMVKAFAYGSSSYEVARLLQYNKVDYLGVAYPDEGVELRKKGITVPIMVMNVSTEAVEQLLRYRLEPSVYSLELLKEICKILKNIQSEKPLSIHVELDSGMHRLGFNPDELPQIIDLLIENESYIKPLAVFSHLAVADEQEHDSFSFHQIEIFEHFANQLEKALNVNLIKHILNSAGISRFQSKQLDMVRLGIGLHGIDPGFSLKNQLKPVATLKTVIAQIKTIEAGESVGYGRHCISEKVRKIATLSIGYADGLLRACGNENCFVLINNTPCPLVGNICMDMCFADVTVIEAGVGDEVIIFGEDMPIENMSKGAGTIPYEILTHISSRVPRIFFES